MIYTVQLICDMIQNNGLLTRGEGLLGNVSIIIERLELRLLFLDHSVGNNSGRGGVMGRIMWW